MMRKLDDWDEGMFDTLFLRFIRKIKKLIVSLLHVVTARSKIG